VIRLALRVRRDEAELVLAELLELAPNGVEETDCGEVVEFAVYGAPGELPALPALRAAAGEAFVEVESEEIPDDWYDGWREFHRPVVVGERLRVRPPWEPAAGEEDLIDVAIDPGMAFGTGAHPTTRMCLELLLELAPGGAFADLGCGSGVLAIAAAKLGWAPVVALDHEVTAVEAAAANARANGVELEVRRWDLRAEPAPTAPTIAANLLRPLLLELARALGEGPTQLVAGGLLAEEADEVAAAFAARGLGQAARRTQGDWAAILLTRSGGPAG
jgi:ribosomal protein L11 methyltransferase